MTAITATTATIMEMIQLNNNMANDPVDFQMNGFAGAGAGYDTSHVKNRW